MSRRIPTRKELGPPSHNVQVAVRARPINEKEIKEGQIPIVKCNEKEATLTVKGKQYGPFDTVFGTTAEQPDVYERLLRKQIEQVMKGYNCTCFAYGQTGTGKTYCMEGGADKAYSGDWKSDPHLGVIPRAVEHIFDSLEKQELEFCVRVSYIELYNEELYDLLAANVDDNTRIRIFEDPAKKGSVIVNGAEEVPVRSRSEVFSLLQRGAERKTMAATLMNNRSSRSHCVFIVSVVVRETNLDGEELVRHGKLNLVDLAGSESIGRSGAEGKRAKEAGNINQSLLTLGRCINALTTNAGHIPYRESKLTRLLQDSLGGSTITTIIATISPASSNFEETISTLDYASRAKNIKNHPEANEKLSRKALFKEYTTEIEKLRRDLRVAREKNGIFLSQESYEGMEEKIQGQAKIIEDLEERIEATMEKVQLLMDDLGMMDEQYRTVYARKIKLEDKLEMRVGQLEETKKLLAETKIREEATKHALDEMHEIASRIRNQAKETQNMAMDAKLDVAALWSKMETVVDLVNANFDATKCFAEKIRNLGNATSTEVEKLKAVSVENMENLKTDIASLSNSLTSGLDTWSSDRNTSADRLRELFLSSENVLKEFDRQQSSSLGSHKNVVDEQLLILHGSIEKGLNLLKEFMTSSDANLKQIQEVQQELTAKISNQNAVRVEMINAERRSDESAANSEMEKQLETISQGRGLIEKLLNVFTTQQTAVLQKFEENKLNIERSAEDRTKFLIESTRVVNDKCGTISTKSSELDALLGEHARNVGKELEEILLCHRVVEISSNDMNKMTKTNTSQMLEISSELRKYETTTIENSIVNQAEIDNLLRNSIKEKSNEMRETIEKEDSHIVSISSRISAIVNEEISRTDKHIDEDIRIVEKTGRTPVKRTYDIIDEFDFVPKPKKLLKEFGVDKEARKSIYTTRESMLIPQEDIMSPQTIKTKMGGSKLDDIHETDESNATDGSVRSSRGILKPSN